MQFLLGLSATLLALSPEPIAPAPRETEVLTIMPRVFQGTLPARDPAFIIRGAISDNGTYELPLPTSKFEINRRQLELLRGLDKLRLFETEDDLDPKGPDSDPARRIIGPEPLLVPPRVVK